jgi:uncharacterized protein (TIGR01244 family)
MDIREIYNYIEVDDRISTGGQPTGEQIKAAAADGFTTVISLLPAQSEHALSGEAELVAALGMTYFYIPVEWGNPTEVDFSAFEQAMQAVRSGKVLIHCAANFRAAAFSCLYAQKHLGWTEARAEELRASIWRGSEYPVWEEFIRRIRAKLS